MEQGQNAEQNYGSDRNRFQAANSSEDAEQTRHGSGPDHRGPDLETYGMCR